MSECDGKGPFCEDCGDCLVCYGEDECSVSDDGKHVEPRPESESASGELRGILAGALEVALGRRASFSIEVGDPPSPHIVESRLRCFDKSGAVVYDSCPQHAERVCNRCGGSGWIMQDGPNGAERLLCPNTGGHPR
jgi:hypothetical protein